MWEMRISIAFKKICYFLLRFNKSELINLTPIEMSEAGYIVYLKWADIM